MFVHGTKLITWFKLHLNKLLDLPVLLNVDNLLEPHYETPLVYCIRLSTELISIGNLSISKPVSTTIYFTVIHPTAEELLLTLLHVHTRLSNAVTLQQRGDGINDTVYLDRSFMNRFVLKTRMHLDDYMIDTYSACIHYTPYITVLHGLLLDLQALLVKLMLDSLRSYYEKLVSPAIDELARLLEAIYKGVE